MKYQFKNLNGLNRFVRDVMQYEESDIIPFLWNNNGVIDFKKNEFIIELPTF